MNQTIRTLMEGDLSLVEKPEHLEQAIASKLHNHFTMDQQQPHVTDGLASEATEIGSVTNGSQFVAPPSI